MDNLEFENAPTAEENNSVNNSLENNEGSTNNNPSPEKKSKAPLASLIISIIALVVSCIILFTGRGKNNSDDIFGSVSGGHEVSSAASSHVIGDGNIAYVNTERLLSEYKFSVKLNEDFLTEQAKSRASLESRLRQFEKKYNEFVEKARLGSFMSQASMESQQQELVDEERNLQQMELDLSQKLMEKQGVITQQLYDTIVNFIGEYNKDAKFSLILNNAIGSGVLYSEPAMDITNEVVEKLNARYAKVTGN